MKVIFISGPYRDKRGAWFIRENIRRAEAAALFVWEAGGVAICPHMNTRLWDGALPDDVFLQGDLELVGRSDAVYAIDGWHGSTGARGEVERARELGKPVFDDKVKLLRYLWNDGIRSAAELRSEFNRGGFLSQIEMT